MSCMTIHHHWAESACMLIEESRPSVYAQFFFFQFLWMTSKSWEKQLSGESTDSPDNCFPQPSQGSVVPVCCLPCFQVAYIAHSPGTMTSSAFVYVKMFGCHVGNAWMAKIQENIARWRHVLEGKEHRAAEWISSSAQKKESTQQKKYAIAQKPHLFLIVVRNLHPVFKRCLYFRPYHVYTLRTTVFAILLKKKK